MDCTCCSQTVFNNPPVLHLLPFYLLTTSDAFGHFTAVTSTPVASQPSSIWHDRLEHPSDVKLNSLCNVIPSLKPSCNKGCQICSMAKLKRLPFPFHNNISPCAFDLIHMDVWGPYSTPTLDSFKYFLTIVDDATKATWLFLMKSKFEVRQLFSSFYTMVHT